MSVLRVCTGSGLNAVSVDCGLQGAGTSVSPLSVKLAPAGGIYCGGSGLYIVQSGAGGCTIAYSYENVDQSGTPSVPIEASSSAAIQVEVKNDVINFWGNPSGTWILDKVFSGGSYFIGEVDNGNSGASKTIDFSAKANQKLTLTANCALSFTSPSSARSVLIRFIQDGTGGWTPTMPSGVLGTLTVATGVTQQTVVNLYYDGTNYHV